MPDFFDRFKVDNYQSFPLGESNNLFSAGSSYPMFYGQVQLSALYGIPISLYTRFIGMSLFYSIQGLPASGVIDFELRVNNSIVHTWPVTIPGGGSFGETEFTKIPYGSAIANVGDIMRVTMKSQTFNGRLLAINLLVEGLQGEVTQ